MRILLFICCFFSLAFAQTKYWVFFTDKDTIHTKPQLSVDAIESRLSQNIDIDGRDYPVSQVYIDSLRQMGIQTLHTSRWLNGVSAYLTTQQLAMLWRVGFIRQAMPVKELRITHAKPEKTIQIDSVGDYLWQSEMLNVNLLHASGYNGKGVKVAIMDDGFVVADTLTSLKPIFKENRILGTYDFVSNNDIVYDECTVGCHHGTWVFTILAGNTPGKQKGTAPGASFYLFRTENSESETHQEEDNWVVAAERADSLGAQVFSTSLGYYNFDEPEDDYTHASLDGNTAIITKAADIAASKGILVVNSAGNEGNSPWRKIIPPSDGKQVIAVGGIDKNKKRAVFSSQGYSADGRVKPDVMAVAQQTYFQDTNGWYWKGNGTSFSCPIISGMLACVRQARPLATADEIRAALKASCDRYEQPDSLYGYGIPDAQKLILLLTPSTSALSITPNPTQGQFLVSVTNSGTAYNGKIEIFEAATGRKMCEKNAFISSQSQTVVSFDLSLVDGVHVVRLTNADAKKVQAVQKLMISR